MSSMLDGDPGEGMEGINFSDVITEAQGEEVKPEAEEEVVFEPVEEREPIDSGFKTLAEANKAYKEAHADVTKTRQEIAQLKKEHAEAKAKAPETQDEKEPTFDEVYKLIFGKLRIARQEKAQALEEGDNEAYCEAEAKILKLTDRQDDLQELYYSVEQDEMKGREESQKFQGELQEEFETLSKKYGTGVADEVEKMKKDFEGGKLQLTPQSMMFEIAALKAHGGKIPIMIPGGSGMPKTAKSDEETMLDGLASKINYTSILG